MKIKKRIKYYNIFGIAALIYFIIDLISKLFIQNKNNIDITIYFILYILYIVLYAIYENKKEK